MQAIELNADIDDKHQIHLQIPEHWPQKSVKVVVTLLEPEEVVVKQKRVFGQFSGQIKIAADFDSELPDEFWLGDKG